ncbi:hypothetical protein JZ751_027519 [Albula glossodonta]|uniref:Pyrin domain-containing protein n=1 Tax=Albula glossodonta TaxID=121402 RepID=A0A8T2NN98_9TELE|nr:hypothetical protein JZ751_027519 [Albula glossodonta]
MNFPCHVLCLPVMAGVPSMLITTLDDLIADELKRFKFWLSNKLPEGFDSIGRGKLEGKGVLETVDLMVRAYGEEDAVKVTLYALRKTDQNNLAQKLEKAHIRSPSPPRERGGSTDEPLLSK